MNFRSLWFKNTGALYLNVLFLFLSIGGERFGVWDSAAEESASREDCSVLRLPAGPRTEKTHHFCRVHARGAYSAQNFRTSGHTGLFQKKKTCRLKLNIFLMCRGVQDVSWRQRSWRHIALLSRTPRSPNTDALGWRATKPTCRQTATDKSCQMCL